MGQTSSVTALSMVVLVATACSDERPPLGGSTVGSGGGVGVGAGGDGTGTGGTSMGTGGSGNAPPDFTPCASPPVDYPSAPYGDEEGDTVVPLELAGWVNADGMGLANTEPFVTFDMVDIRGAGTTHVMLHLAATW